MLNTQKRQQIETIIIAHRGDSGHAPENTISAFKSAIDVGADGIELDVHLSKDGHLIVIHDETVNRTSNGRGAIEALTLEEIQALDAGSWFSNQFKGEKIPTLDEVVDYLQTHHYDRLLNIEIKSDKVEYLGIEEKIASLMLSQEWSFHYLYSSFNINSLIRINDYDPDAEKAYLFSKNQNAFTQSHHSTIIDSIHPNIRFLMGIKEQIPHYPKPIRAWTLNRDCEMEFAFRMHLDAIHTDYPQRALELRKHYQSSNNLPPKN